MSSIARDEASSRTWLRGGRLGPRPPRLGELGMALFLVSLTSLFLAALLGYVIIRLRSPAPAGAIEMPATLWGSTGLILLASLLFQRARRAIELERPRALRVRLAGAAGASLAFLLVQLPSLAWLLESHRHAVAESGLHLHGLALCLLGLHAAHILGGLIPLGVVLNHALRGRYDHEHHPGVIYCTMYSHFLGVVWLVLFATLLVLG